MQGARKYATMFCSGQHGRLYLVSGEHARGKTFHIWVLPDDTPISCMPWSVKDAVEVYGITGGQPGWSETYGWLHKGKWQQDFAALVDEQQVKIANEVERRGREKAAANEAERARKSSLLAAYK